MSYDELCLAIGESLPALFECTPAPREGVRVRTPLMYPDGGMVDVFVLERSGRYSVTDFGETLGWLRMQSVSTRRSPKQNRMVEDTCQTLGVELHRGQLMLRSGAADGLGESVLRLAQAAVRVSDLWFTLRTRAVETVADEVTDWLVEKEISFDRAVRQHGRSGQSLDGRLPDPYRGSNVAHFLLSTGSRGAGAPYCGTRPGGMCGSESPEVSQSHLAFVSLFDDTEDVWREEDFSLVEQQSEVARWSRPDEFERILLAA